MKCGQSYAWSITNRACCPRATTGWRAWPSGLLGDVTSSMTGRAALGIGAVALARHSKKRAPKKSRRSDVPLPWSKIQRRMFLLPHLFVLYLERLIQMT